MKKGYHSTQPRAFNTIPRSIYLGVILGFGIGMVASGFFRVEREYIPEIIFAAIGYLVGKWYDDKYCAEKDVPAEELEALNAQETGETETPDTPEDTEASGEPADAGTPEDAEASEEPEGAGTPEDTEASEEPEDEQTPVDEDKLDESESAKSTEESQQE